MSFYFPVSIKIMASFSETCYDGKQNEGEQGVDCGGPCLACNGKLYLMLFITV